MNEPTTSCCDTPDVRIDPECQIYCEECGRNLSATDGRLD